MSIDYDVRAVVRAAIEGAESVDPGDIAVVVAEQIPADMLRPVLAAVLRDYVRTVIHDYRRWREPDPTPDADAPTSSPATSARSAKVAGYRAWGRVLAAPVAVEGNVWKRFGECRTSDLAFLAAHRRVNAAESIAAAQRYENYVVVMLETGAATVADLTDAAIAAIETGS